jgi:septal ring factor EnvC (AmiA/AmiB activator)
MVLYTYKNRSQRLVITFLGKSADFNKSVLRVEYLKRIADARKVQIAQINATSDDLNQTVKKLEIIKEDQSKLLESKEKEKQKFNEEKGEKEKVVAQLQSKEKDLKQQIRKKQEDANRLNLAIKKVIEEEVRKAREAAILVAKKRKKELEKAEKQKKESSTSTTTVASTKEDQKKIDKANQEIAEAESAKSSTEVFALSEENQKLSSGFENNKKRLPWPVSGGVVVSTYGEHEHPVLKGIKIKNNGIDIKTKTNAESRTVFDGEVTGVINIPGAGKAVIIRHGEYLSVYSNLSSTSVSKGDKVKARQSIGIVSLGESGSGELHFEIWKGQTLQNPQIWLGGK